MKTPDRLCFGYGSLVNRKTHDFAPSRPAEIKDWQRSWSHRIRSSGQGASSLTITPAPGVSIKGLVSTVRPDQIAGLDAREAGYDLHTLPAPVFGGQLAKTDPIHTYISADDQIGDAEHPILQSYLDTVLLGFLREFAESGVTHFLDTTVGWQTPILKDRINPIYPRTTPLAADHADFFDQELKKLGAVWMDQTR